MPIAGDKREDRANAHLRWADRYSNYGDVHKATAHFGRAMEYTGFGAVGSGDETPDARLSDIRFREKTANTTWYDASLGGVAVIIGVRPNAAGWTGVNVKYIDKNETELNLTIVPIGDDETSEVLRLRGLRPIPLPNASLRGSFAEDLGELHKKAKNTRVVFADFIDSDDLDIQVRLAQGVVAFLIEEEKIDDGSLVVTSLPVLDDSYDTLRRHNFTDLGFSMMVNTAKDVAGAGASNNRQRR
jgi:hypothetical protein